MTMMNVIPGSIQVLSKKVPRKLRDSKGPRRCVCAALIITCVVGLVLPGPDLRAHVPKLLLAVFHVITFSRSYFAYFL